MNLFCRQLKMTDDYEENIDTYQTNNDKTTRPCWHPHGKVTEERTPHDVTVSYTEELGSQEFSNSGYGRSIAQMSSRHIPTAMTGVPFKVSACLS